MATVNPYEYSRYQDDASGMLDAIDHDNGSPVATQSPTAVQGQGSAAVNPYEYSKYEDDAAGMLDAVNHDAGIPAYAHDGHAIRSLPGEPTDMLDALDRAK